MSIKSFDFFNFFKDVTNPSLAPLHNNTKYDALLNGLANTFNKLYQRVQMLKVDHTLDLTKDLEYQKYLNDNTGTISQDQILEYLSKYLDTEHFKDTLSILMRLYEYRSNNNEFENLDSFVETWIIPSFKFFTMNAGDLHKTKGTQKLLERLFEFYGQVNDNTKMFEGVKQHDTEDIRNFRFNKFTSYRIGIDETNLKKNYTNVTALENIQIDQFLELQKHKYVVANGFVFMSEKDRDDWWILDIASEIYKIDNTYFVVRRNQDIYLYSDDHTIYDSNHSFDRPLWIDREVDVEFVPKVINHSDPLNEYHNGNFYWIEKVSNDVDTFADYSYNLKRWHNNGTTVVLQTIKSGLGIGYEPLSFTYNSSSWPRINSILSVDYLWLKFYNENATNYEFNEEDVKLVYTFTYEYQFKKPLGSGAFEYPKEKMLAIARDGYDYDPDNYGFYYKILAKMNDYNYDDYHVVERVVDSLFNQELYRLIANKRISPETAFDIFFVERKEYYEDDYYTNQGYWDSNNTPRESPPYEILIFYILDEAENMYYDLTDSETEERGRSRFFRRLEKFQEVVSELNQYGIRIKVIPIHPPSGDPNKPYIAHPDFTGDDNILPGSGWGISEDGNRVSRPALYSELKALYDEVVEDTRTPPYIALYVDISGSMVPDDMEPGLSQFKTFLSGLTTTYSYHEVNEDWLRHSYEYLESLDVSEIRSFIEEENSDKIILPEPPSSSPSHGDYWIVSNDGSVEINGIKYWRANDVIAWNGNFGYWEKNNDILEYDDGENIRWAIDHKLVAMGSNQSDDSIWGLPDTPDMNTDYEQAGGLFVLQSEDIALNIDSWSDVIWIDENAIETFGPNSSLLFCYKDKTNDNYKIYSVRTDGFVRENDRMDLTRVLRNYPLSSSVVSVYKLEISDKHLLAYCRDTNNSSLKTFAIILENTTYNLPLGLRTNDINIYYDADIRSRTREQQDWYRIWDENDEEIDDEEVSAMKATLKRYSPINTYHDSLQTETNLCYIGQKIKDEFTPESYPVSFPNVGNSGVTKYAKEQCKIQVKDNLFLRQDGDPDDVNCDCEDQRDILYVYDFEPMILFYDLNTLTPDPNVTGYPSKVSLSNIGTTNDLFSGYEDVCRFESDWFYYIYDDGSTFPVEVRHKIRLNLYSQFQEFLPFCATENLRFNWGMHHYIEYKNEDPVETIPFEWVVGMSEEIYMPVQTYNECNPVGIYYTTNVIDDGSTIGCYLEEPKEPWDLYNIEAAKISLV